MILMQKPTILLEKKTEFFFRVILGKINLVLENLLDSNGVIQLQLCDGTIFTPTSSFPTPLLFTVIMITKLQLAVPASNIASVIKDWTFKQDYQWFANDMHNVKFGFNVLNAQNLSGRNKQR